MIKYVIFDFNGTILDDVDLCITLLNEFLEEQHKPLVDYNTYKSIFGFPIKNYYLKAGISFKNKTFEEYAVIYQDKYEERSKVCKLFPEVIDTLETLGKKDITLVVLSATEENHLKKQLEYYNIDKYFKYILGTKNLEGTSKIMVGYNFIKTNHIDPREVLLIGDTTHDFEVSEKLGSKCLLYTLGHQDVKTLSKTGATLIDNLNKVIDFIG